VGTHDYCYDSSIQFNPDYDKMTVGNNGGMPCSNYCSSGWNNEAAKGSTCVKAVNTTTEALAGCGAIIPSGGLTCYCKNPPTLSNTTAELIVDVAQQRMEPNPEMGATKNGVMAEGGCLAGVDDYGVQYTAEHDGRCEGKNCLNGRCVPAPRSLNNAEGYSDADLVDMKLNLERWKTGEYKATRLGENPWLGQWIQDEIAKMTEKLKSPAYRKANENTRCAWDLHVTSSEDLTAATVAIQEADEVFLRQGDIYCKRGSCVSSGDGGHCSASIDKNDKTDKTIPNYENAHLIPLGLIEPAGSQAMHTREEGEQCGVGWVGPRSKLGFWPGDYDENGYQYKNFEDYSEDNMKPIGGKTHWAQASRVIDDIAGTATVTGYPWWEDQRCKSHSCSCTQYWDPLWPDWISDAWNGTRYDCTCDAGETPRDADGNIITHVKVVEAGDNEREHYIKDGQRPAFHGLCVENLNRAGVLHQDISCMSGQCNTDRRNATTTFAQDFCGPPLKDLPKWSWTPW
jgi:hypothetical protein